MKHTEKFEIALNNAIGLKYAFSKDPKGTDEALQNMLGDTNITAKDFLNMSFSDFIETNANEAMHSANIGFGKEFVTTEILVSELIKRIEASPSLLGRVEIKQMLANKMSFPVQGTRLRMKRVNEATDVPSNTKKLDKPGTMQYSIECTEFALSIYISDTLIEDSVIGIVEYVVSALTDSYEHTLHHILINGDMATTGNINGTVTLSDDVTAFDWARKLAIAGGKVVTAGVFDLTDLRKARAFMGIKGLNPDDLAITCDIDTYFNTLNIWEVLTKEKFGDAATIINGKLAKLDGIDIYPREEVSKTLASGLIDPTPTNNVKGNIVLIHLPSAKFGIRRALRTEMSRYAEERQTAITGSSRVGMKFLNVQNNETPTAPTSLIVVDL